ncbi:hypothetical protein PINS_up012792 [Pythium insidiosum]|nr:hypothetical protein PINS_up012792 [Pythium insidiosum]
MRTVERMMTPAAVSHDTRPRKQHYHHRHQVDAAHARPQVAITTLPTVTSLGAARYARRRSKSTPCDYESELSAVGATPYALSEGSGRGGSSRRTHATHRRDRHAPTPAAPRRKMVTFKNVSNPEVAPNPREAIESYDELLFNVAGLYHTLSPPHDADGSSDLDDDLSSHTSSSSSINDDDDEPLEPSMQLMIAEFLYRSAVYLGYPPEDDIWIPGFRENKRFSTNDVKRWRRLAHHDWEREDRDMELHAASSRRRHGAVRSIKAAVSQWITRHRRHSAPPAISLDRPPVVPETTDLSRLVTIANSCVYFGAFRFTARDIRKLCNVKIDA